LIFAFLKVTYMKKHLLTIVSLFFVSLIFAQASFTPGNLVIYRVGDGVSSLANTGNPIFIDEYTPTGSLVQSIAAPTTVSGSNKQCIASGTATSEGLITRSENGKFLTFTGYARDLGGAGSVSATTSATVGRTVALMDYTGTINTSTSLSDFASANNVRSAVANNAGTQVWFTGGNTGVGTAPIGATTSTVVSTTIVNLRQINLFNNQLYVSNNSLTNIRIGTIGTGAPTTTGQAITGLPTFITTGSVYSYVFFDMSTVEPGYDVLYVASDDATGLTKYSLVSGTWVNNGVIGVATDAYRGLTAVLNGTTVTLYATRKGGSTAVGGGEFVSLVDASGYNAAFAGAPTVLATATNAKAFRGIAFAPVVGVVPLKFISFDGAINKNGVNLNWVTNEELDVATFTIQKSTDGIHFENIHTITASNNGTLQKYSFQDVDKIKEVSIYRIKATDINGAITFSDIINIRSEANKNNLIDIYPTIVNNTITIDWNIVKTKGTLIIVNSLGKKVITQNIAANTFTQKINVNTLPSGIYFIKYLTTDGLMQTVKFIKQ
jgi:hypothetical protein